MVRLTPEQNEKMVALLDLLEEHDLLIFFGGSNAGHGLSNFRTGRYQRVIGLWENLYDYLNDSDATPEGMAQSFVFMAEGLSEESEGR